MSTSPLNRTDPSDSQVDRTFAAQAGADNAPTLLMTADADLAPTQVELPLLGRQDPTHQRRLLTWLLAGSIALLALLAFFALRAANEVAQHISITGQSLMHSQRLAKSVSQAVVGTPSAFADVKDSADYLGIHLPALKAGNSALGISSLPDSSQADLDKILPLVERSVKSAKIVLDQQKVLTQVSGSLRSINQQSSDLLEIAETVSSQKLQQNAPAAEISAAGHLVMLTQRIGKSANEFLSADGVRPEAMFLLGKDLNSFKDISHALLDGNAELRLGAARDNYSREQLQVLIKQYQETRAQAGAILGNLQSLVAAREAQDVVIQASEPLRKQLTELQNQLSAHSGLGLLSILGMALAALVALASAAGLAYLQVHESRQRQLVAEQQRATAEQQERELQRINDANQAAILRLMNELQTVAEGDLTQEATVTEDITGAIADSVNYTVEELRSLVSNVQVTAERVTHTTQAVDSTSVELLSASTQQLAEIQRTGQSVLDMASRINDVSAQAQSSAQVARQSLQAAESGLSAVQNAINGMNGIRDQIQETSKRIKRLGESSQEIGEITELISDLTEQTNVLALNAAIQAASAGSAGRGFSVVAEEVQRLAERSADATRQITNLVKTIQSDTQDAVSAMERSTQGVVEGTKLSDHAGTALHEIDAVSRRLAELIEQISSSTAHEASSANVVAENIQKIFAVTEQTGAGTRATADQVRQLSQMAQELRQSVSRFKIA